MKVVKKINNNVAVCLDGDNHECIAFGKGIGFPKTPYELSDLSIIYRTYYNIDSNLTKLANEIPNDIFEISSNIVNFANENIKQQLNPNLFFTLADHINFAIKRLEQNMHFRYPYNSDVLYHYPDEMSVGEKAVAYINKEKGIYLPKDESVAIAMHILNSEIQNINDADSKNIDHIIQEIVEIVEQDFGFKVNTNGFNYLRFISHLQYLLNKNVEDVKTPSTFLNILETLKSDHNEAYISAVHIKEYLLSEMGLELDQDDVMYLILHIDRLCTRDQLEQ